MSTAMLFILILLITALVITTCTALIKEFNAIRRDAELSETERRRLWELFILACVAFLASAFAATMLYIAFHPLTPFILWPLSIGIAFYHASRSR